MKNRLIILTTGQKLLLVSFTIVAIIAVIYFEVNQYRDRKEQEIDNQVKSQQMDNMFNYYEDNNNTIVQN